MEEVILVNEKDEPVGTLEKMEAHRKGSLHRAFSIFIFSTDGKLWIHQRAHSKYHSGGKWTNTCCGHPRPGEHILAAAKRRLKEECSLDCVLVEKFHFTYKAAVGQGLTEHEYDHVFFGITEVPPVLNEAEAEAWKLIDKPSLSKLITDQPDQFSSWFLIASDHVFRRWNA